MVSEQFRPGYNDQISLLNDPGRYPGFEIRNIVANGDVWTDAGKYKNYFSNSDIISNQVATGWI